MDFKEIESKFQPTEDSKCAESENGMVATAFPDATQAGVEMLKQGGNAVDTACAAALALGVCEPQSSGIGGQTMMLISLGGKVLAIDGSSRAPSLAHVSGIYKGDRSYGYRATTVPSTPATLWYVNKHYGQLSWEKVLEPAIRLAEAGYTITPLQHDLAFIPWPIVRKPLRRKFRGLFVYSMPPPGAGRSLLFTLMMINMIKSKHLNRDEFDRALLLVEIFRNTQLERSDRPFDPDYYPQVAGENMLKRTYVRKCIHKITRESQIYMPIHETEDEVAGETTHLSVIDNSGMAVSLTQSIEKVYGSKAAAAGLGFLYNNYLSDYEYKIFSHPFYLRPNAVPWATVAPTLIFRNKEEIWLAVGSPGSERIFSSIAQFLIHVVDENQPIDEAMRAPRLHCSLGGRVSLEAERFSDELVTFFREKGYRIDKRKPFSFYLGAIHAVLKKHDGSGFQGVAEVRRDGTAGGY